MRMAVTYENGAIFQHPGHTERFGLCDMEDGQTVSSEEVDTAGSGHGAPAAGRLVCNASATCSHHGEHHEGSCGSHGCGHHSCGDA